MTIRTPQSSTSFWLLLFFILLIPSLQAQNEATMVEGQINENTVWTLNNSPYVVTNTVTVNEGVTLTIEAGVVVKHNANFFRDIIVVRGTLIAQGTSTDPIVFTEIRDDAFGGDTNNNGDSNSPSPGNWRAVRILSSSGNSSVLENCYFRYGGYEGVGDAALVVNGASPLVNNCTFFHCEKGLTVTGGGTPTISNNTFEANTSTPVNISLGTNPTFSGNALINNDRNGIGIEAFNYNTSGASYTLGKTNFAGINNIPYIVNDHRFEIGEGVTLTIEPGVVIKHDDFNFFNIMTVRGTLLAQGTAEEPIVFTDITDDAFGGDTNNNGNDNDPVAGGWQGVRIMESSGNSTVFEYCHFRYGGYEDVGTAALMINGSSPMVNNCTFFTCEKGLTVTGGGTPTISNNTFEANTFTPINISLNASPVFSGNALINNDRNGIGIEAYNYNTTGAAYTLRKTDIAGVNNIPYIVNDHRFEIGEGVTLTIEPGVVIKHDDFNFFDIMTVRGTLLAQGTAEEPIVFTDITDDAFGGDTNNNGDENGPAAGGWQGIRIMESSGNSSVFEYCHFRYGGNEDVGAAALIMNGSSSMVNNCTFFTCEKGLTVTGGGTPTISNNTFEANTFTPINISLNANPTFSNNTLINNNRNGVGIEAYNYNTTGAAYTLRKTDIAGVNNIPYIINDHRFEIGEGVTLTIEPGVVIKHDDFSSFDLVTVRGTLIARGTVEEPIVFTNIRDDAFGGDTNNNGDDNSPEPGSWQAIRVLSSSGNSSVFENCHFRYGGNDNLASAALAVIGSSPQISRNQFFRCEKPITVTGGGAPTIEDNEFIENTFAPINLSLNAFPIFNGNIIEENRIKAIGIESFEYTENGAQYTLPKRNFGGIDNIPYTINRFGMEIGPNVTLTIDPGVVIKHNTFGSVGMMNIQGTLFANGTFDEPIIFTDVKDDAFGGDTNNDGENSTPGRGDWESLRIENGGYARFSNCHFRYGGDSRDGALTIADSMDVSNCWFTNNTIGLLVTNGGIAHLDESRFENNAIGIRKTGGQVTIQNSNLLDNSDFAIDNATTDTLDARLNWWGDPTGPFHATNVDGLGNPVTDYVLFEPFFFQEVEPSDTITITGCPDFDIILSDQNELDAFVATYSSRCDSIFGSLIISRNVADITGLEFLTYIGGNLRMSDNDQLTGLSGFNNLTTIAGQLYLANNDALTSLNGLSNLNFIGGGVTMRSNSDLTDCEVLCNLLNEGKIAGNINISDNPGNCSSIEVVQSSCTGNGLPPALSIVNLPDAIEEGALLQFDIITNFPPVEDLPINIVSSNSLEVPLTSPIIMEANTSSVQVSLQLPDDEKPEIEEMITISVAAANYASDKASVLLTDIADMPGIELLIVNDTVSETAGLNSIQGILQRVEGNPDQRLTVELKADPGGTLFLPSRLSLAPGQMEVRFNIGVSDNNLVDGDRAIDISATVILASCNCKAPAGSIGESTDDIWVIDNDGPALTIRSNTLALEEGAEEAAILTISRNTSLEKELTVNLSSSKLAEIELPASVLIPQGAASVQVPVRAIADNISDGNQQVSIQASAEGFAIGIIWLITTDVNKPDLQIAAVELEERDVPALSQFPFTVSLINEGFATAPRNISLVGYLSEDDQIDDSDHIIGEYFTASAIPVGDTLEFLGVGLAPLQPKSYQLLFRINPEQTSTEIFYFNNTSEAITVNILPDYFGSAQVDETRFVQGEEIIIYGSSFNPDDTPMPNVALDLLITTGEVLRIIPVQTDASANYSFAFNPLPTEAGRFEVRANFPGQNGQEAQDSFDILGVQINGGVPFRWELILNQTIDSTIEITNLTNVPLSNLTMEPIELPNGCSLSFGSIPLLEGNATLEVEYSVTGTEVSPLEDEQEVVVLISTEEGVAQEWQSEYLCQERAAHIRASISSIDASYSQDKIGVFEFELYNIGMGSTGDISVEIPDVDWMGLTSPAVMPSLAPGDTTKVILQWLPTETLPLNTPARGNMIISTANGNSLNIPFLLEKVSEKTGNVLVDVIDEYTYFTEEAPHVAGAKVRISHYFTGEVYAEGLTDEDGLFLAEDLPEGTLRIRVQAESHDSYDGILYVSPGRTVNRVIFISYRAVSFTWDVVPTTIDDQYQVDLIMEFETNVPVPVVEMEFPDTLPQLFGGDTYPFFITLTNHGLIAARDVTLNLPEDPEYEFLTNYVVQDLPALSAIQIPVVMRRRADTDDLTAKGTSPTFEDISRKLDMDLSQINKGFLKSGTGGCLVAIVIYSYVCGENGVSRGTGKKVTIRGRVESCGGGGFIGGGGTGALGFIAGTSSPSDCRTAIKCASSLGLSVLGCLPGPVGIAAGFLGCVLDPGALGCAGILLGPGSSKPFPGIPIPSKRVLPVIGCIAGLASSAMTCGWIPNIPFLQSPEIEAPKSNLQSTNFPDILQQPMDDIDAYIQAFEAMENIDKQYYGDLFDNDNIIDFATLVDPFIVEEQMIDNNERSAILEQMQNFDISPAAVNQYIDRWNTTVQAWSEGANSPNAAYPDIVDRGLLEAYRAVMQATLDYAEQRGFADAESMLITAMEDLYTLSQPSTDPDDQRVPNSVCASVTINISQEVTMTREAFEGTLTVFNGHPDLPIQNLKLSLEILDENGVPSNDLFEIETSSLQGLSGIDGTGELGADQDGTAVILFIPEPAAAPETPRFYSFGGTISYLDPFSETMVTIALSPVTLQVNPSPDLFLHYFMQRDILGDDPLTQAVEPIIPADLAVMIENNGYGVAQNVTIESAQPEIVENEKGLAVHFKLIGSNLQGEPVNLGVTNIDFGNIEPFSTKIGQWYFTSDLLGHFVNYRTELVHLNSRGNPDLSLVSGAQLHELTRTISVYGAAEDGIDDFLVNEVPDREDMPDAIYLSQGNLVYDVFQADTASFSGDIRAPGHTTTLEVTPSRLGWNYIKLDDPGEGNFELVSVTRSDGQEISLKNVWLTHVTIRDQLTPKYEDKFHLVDDFQSFSPATYTVVWSAENANPLEVVSITGFPEEVSSEQTTTLRVTFNKGVDTTTFTQEDLMMQFQGGGNIIDETVRIIPIDDRTFDIDLSSLTTGNGFYVFTVQAAEIRDVTGTFGETGKQISWTQFLTSPAVNAFLKIPDDKIGNAFDTIQLLFNLPLDLNTVLPERFSVWKDGIEQPGTFSVNVINDENTLLENTLFVLTDLGQFMDENGEYEFVVDLPNIQTQEGVPGLVQQSIVLTLDTEGPVLTNMVQINKGALDDQHYTGINMNFSEAVDSIPIEAIELRRDGILQDLSDVKIEAINKDWVQVQQFGVFTYPEGDYFFSIDMSKVKDLADNPGTGVESLNWTVNRTTALTISNVTISPDLGFSAVDGITSNKKITVSFQIDEAARNIRLYQNDNGVLSLLGRVDSAPFGEVSIPALLKTGGSTALTIKLFDLKGNEVIANKSIFIDETNLSANFDFIPNQRLRNHPSELLLEFTAPVLDEGTIDNGLVKTSANSNATYIKATFNNNVINTDDWTLNRLTDTSYLVSGLEQLKRKNGEYKVTVDLSAFEKLSSGIKGVGTVTVSWVFDVLNRRPIAEAGPDTTLTAPQVYQLDASASLDLDEDPLTYRWYPPANVQLDNVFSVRPSLEITAEDDGKKYRFLLSVSDGEQFSTDEVAVSVAIDAVTSTSDPSPYEKAPSLQLLSYPNPYQYSTNIEFFIPERGPVSLMMVDLNGQMVARLFDQVEKNAGWQRVSFSDPGLPAGMYLLILQTPYAQATKKIIFMKD